MFMDDPQSLPRPEDFLKHYGVKGMRWGVRKRRENSVTRKLIDAKNHRDLKGLSDDQLLLIVNRMQLERKYSDLKRHSKSEAQEYAIDLIKSAGKTTVDQVARQVLAPRLTKIIEDNLKETVTKQKEEKEAIKSAEDAALETAKKRLEKDL